MTGMGWVEAVALCNAKVKETGEHWTLQPAEGGGWYVMHLGPWGATSEAKSFAIIADGIAWTDADGAEEWDEFEAVALAESIERRGYDVELVPA